MKKIVYVFALLFIVVACKNENKDAKANGAIQNNDVKKRALTFEDELIDLRDVNKELIEGIGVQKFGIQKFNDSIYGFVFKLDSTVTNSTVELYSVGVRGYQEDKNVLQFPSSPEINIIENQKYLVLKKKLENIRYFDSIDVYIYERKNWKKSGRLGSIKIRDILFED